MWDIKKKKILNAIIDCARKLGLSESDIFDAQEFLDYNELGLCLDTIATQLYEYDIEITEEFSALIFKALFMMEISPEKYSYLKNLIRNENQIPKPVKEAVANIVRSLEI
jgi:hypothetical protein